MKKIVLIAAVAVVFVVVVLLGIHYGILHIVITQEQLWTGIRWCVEQIVIILLAYAFGKWMDKGVA
ncbi:hypothetical protein [Paenibacillus sp. NPDC101420]|uniref:hypothetical protein n=1 Tax=Paenibacillus sp. NPDC101420 TaxID=3390602 RepID=UPI003D02E469